MSWIKAPLSQFSTNHFAVNLKLIEFFTSLYFRPCSKHFVVIYWCTPHEHFSFYIPAYASNTASGGHHSWNFFLCCHPHIPHRMSHSFSYATFVPSTCFYYLTYNTELVSCFSICPSSLLECLCYIMYFPSD